MQCNATRTESLWLHSPAPSDTHNGCCCDGLSAVWVDDVPRQSHNDTDPLLQFHGR